MGKTISKNKTWKVWWCHPGPPYVDGFYYIKATTEKSARVKFRQETNDSFFLIKPKILMVTDWSGKDLEGNPTTKDL